MQGNDGGSESQHIGYLQNQDRAQGWRCFGSVARVLGKFCFDPQVNNNASQEEQTNLRGEYAKGTRCRDRLKKNCAQTRRRYPESSK